jgi:hypothetical protein
LVIIAYFSNADSDIRRHKPLAALVREGMGQDPFDRRRCLLIDIHSMSPESALSHVPSSVEL